jgi:3-oxoacyl-[acyl-carrier protein] reductase
MSDKKIALVTGASRGIGKATALALTEQGYFVVGTATSENGAATISEYLGDNGAGRVLNVTEEGAIDALVSEVSTTFGPIVVLINNAGITRDNLLMRMKDSEWDDIIQTNLSAIFKLSKAVSRGMMKQRFGRIINVGSVVGSTGNPGQANYAAAKAGVIGFSKSMAREVASRGITVNVVAPGFIDTDMTKVLTDEQKAEIFKRYPCKSLRPT